MGFLFTTKQQTRLSGTFDIVPSLLRLALLQTHLMARAHHVVHRTGWGTRYEVLKPRTLKDSGHSHHSFQPFIVILRWRRRRRSWWSWAFGFSKFFSIVIHLRQCELRGGVWVAWSTMPFNSFIISSTAALVSSTTSSTTGSWSSGDVSPQ